MKAFKLLLVVLMLSLGAKAQTTSWSPTPTPTAQTRLSAGSPQIRWLFGTHAYSIADSLAALKALIVASGGTVTSVAVSGTQGVTVVSGSPITVNGTIALKGDTTYFTTKALIGNYQTKAQNIASYYPLSGNPSGFITNTGSTSGNAGTATKLATARTINGTSFDGTANITITANTPTSVTFNTSGGAGAGSIFNGTSALTVSPVTIGAVPTSTTVNGSALTSNITITANTPNNITFNTSGGAAAGTTFNGGSAVTISPITIGAQPQLSGTGFVKASGTTISYDNSTYLTGNQTITLSGAVTGSGTTAITTTLASSIVGIGNLSATGSPSSTTALFGDNTWKTISAGFANPMTTPGDVIYGGTAGAATRLAIGGANTLLHGGSTAPSYSGVVIADILATGTPSSTTVLFGNGTWGSIAVSGTTGYLARFNTGSSISSSSQMYDDGAGIMLGTTVNSGFQFDATGATRFQGNFGVGKVSTPIPFSYTGSTTGGTLAAATYYYKIVALDNTAVQTNPSSEINATVASGSTGSVNIQWTSVTGANSYRVYRGTTSGGESVYISTTATNFTDIGQTTTGGTPPTLNASAITWLLTDGSINGYKFGVGPGTNNSSSLVIGSGSAMSHNTNGSSIIALGPNALAQNTTGSKLVAIGNNALSQETTNGSSIGIGDAAGQGITTGQYDIAIGPSSLGANTSFSIGIGSQSLANSTGQNNHGIGVNALYYNTTGANNVADGYQAGMFYGGSSLNHITAIDNSVLIGYQAAPNNTGETNEIVIGYNANGKGSNTSTIGNTSTINNYIYGAGVTLPTTAAINATATATAAQLGTGVITSTSAALTTITLPTATAVATQLKSIAGSTFEFTVDNSAGANIVTIALGSGMTQLTDITGGNTLTIPSGSVGVFRLYFSSTTAAYFSRIE